MDTLIQVMGSNGLKFFKTAGAGGSPDGLIGKNDVVLIKVNGEWQYRGGTNTDVVKGLVNAIVHHPDGFTGEIVIVENGQWASFISTTGIVRWRARYSGTPGSRSRRRSAQPCSNVMRAA